MSPAKGQRLARIDAAVTADFRAPEIVSEYGYLPVHYPSPLIDGSDIFVPEQRRRENEPWDTNGTTWRIKRVSLQKGGIHELWNIAVDWKPPPAGGAFFMEPPYQGALTPDAVWAPGAGGTMLEIDRRTGVMLRRVNPFGENVDPSIFASGGPAIDDAGNVYYNVIQFDVGAPWSRDILAAWLVKIDAAGNLLLRVDIATGAVLSQTFTPYQIYGISVAGEPRAGLAATQSIPAASPLVLLGLAVAIAIVAATRLRIA